MIQNFNEILNLDFAWKKSIYGLLGDMKNITDSKQKAVELSKERDFYKQKCEF